MDQFIIHSIARDFPHRFPGFCKIDDDEVRLKAFTDGRSRAEDIVQRFPYQFHMAQVGQKRTRPASASCFSVIFRSSSRSSSIPLP